MISQTRRTKVFAAALVSITVTTVVLESLNSSPLPAGAFSLSEYYYLSPVQDAVTSNSSQNWKSLEISYTDTKQYNVIDYHFVICNGLIGRNGQIQATEKWKRQSSPAADQTIHIGIIVDGKIAFPTDFQIKRTEALVKNLSEKFNIPVNSIYYHNYWYR